MLLVQLSNFDKNKYALARTEDTDPILQDYIDTYEKKFIYDLLGVELGNIVIDELENETGSGSDGLDTRIENVIRPFVVQDATGHFRDWDSNQPRIFQSLGMADMLTAFIYFMYVFETQLQHTQSGVALYMGESAKVLSPREAVRLAERKWNSALNTVDAIQYRCKFELPDVYPEFKGISIDPQNNSIF